MTLAGIKGVSPRWLAASSPARRSVSAATAWGLRAALQLGSTLAWRIAGAQASGPPAIGGRFLFLQFEPALGWALHGTPIFAALKKARPDATIIVACSNPNYDVLASNPHIDHLIKLTSPRDGLLEAWRGAWRISRAYKVDCVVTTAWNRTRRISAMAALLGLGQPIGHSGIPGLYARELSYDSRRSVIENNLDLVRLLGHDPAAHSPEIFCRPDQLAEADALMRRFGLFGEKPIVGIVTQGSGGQPSDWFDERFAHVADRLAEQGCRTVFFGSADQAARIDSIRAAMERPSVSLAGLTSIPVLAGVMASVDLAVTLDTGAMHVGWAVGLPMVVVAPAWQPPIEWLPLDRPSIRILRRNEIWCAHCFKSSCATRECMEETRVPEVVAAALERLSEYPPSDQMRALRREKLIPEQM